MMRRLAERALRDWVFRRRLPAVFNRAPLYCSSNGGLKMVLKPLKAVDPALLQVADRMVRAGDTVWDIGANHGLFAIAAAQRAGQRGQVFAFEPDAWLVQLLRSSACEQAAEAAPITVIPAAVGGATGLRRFSIAARARASNALVEYGASQTGGVVETQTIVATSISDLLMWIGPPQVMKIDVEGAELEILQSAGRLFETVKPIIYCEVFAENRAAVTQILRRAGYALYDGDKTLGNCAPFVAVEQATFNTLAVPKHLMDRLTALTKKNADIIPV